jgi:WD40 repeat protein
LYDPKTFKRLLTLRVRGPVVDASFSPTGHRILVAGGGRVLVRGFGDDTTKFMLRHRGIRAAGCSPSGDEIVTGGDDGNVRLWRADGTLVWTLPLPGHVRRVALTSTRVAAAWVGAGSVAHVALLDSRDGQTVADLRGTTLEFSRDGSLLATGHPDSLARIYQADTGMLVWRLGHGGPVTSVDFRPDGKQLVTASADGAARVFDVVKSTRLLLMPSGTSTVESAHYSDDGRFIVTAGADGVARVWNSLNGRELATLSGHRDTVSGALFNRDGHLVITASDDGTARIWDTGLENQLRVLGRARAEFVRAGFTGGGNLVWAAARDGMARVWRVRDRKLVLAAQQPFPIVDAAGAGARLAVVDEHGDAQLWDIGSRKSLLGLRVPAPGRRVAITDDGRTLLVAGGNVVRVVDLSSLKPIATVRLSGRVNDARFGVGGTFATATTDGRISVWKRSGRLLHAFNGGPTPLVAVAFSPDGRLVAGANRGGTATIWSTVTGRLQHRLRRARTPLTDVEFSHDGRFVATAAIGGDARIWQVSNGIAIHTLKGHLGRIARVAFSPDDRWLVTAGPTTGGLWQVSTGRLLFYLRGHTNQLEDAAFAPDGKHIVTASDDRTVRTYACIVCGSVYELARLAHSQLVRTAALLTPRERRRYFGG